MNHELYIRRCLELAKKGGKFVQTNPMVGAILVYNDRIIGEGYHQKYGTHHAEVNAINSVKPSDLHLIPSSTLYVSLEPCNHTGKTPACTERIIKENIPKVVIACKDPNPNVAGQGVDALKEAGIKVKLGFCVDEAQYLLKPFLVHQLEKRPYIILKFAQSRDYYLGQKNKQVWLSNKHVKNVSHEWRAKIDGILIGKQTAIIDQPSLTTRHFPGDHPTKILIDKELEVNNINPVYDSTSPIIVVNQIKETKEGHVHYLKIDFNYPILPELMKRLYDKSIFILMVEGGAYTLNQFLKLGLWDECRVIQTDKILGAGIKAPTVVGNLSKKDVILNNEILYIERNTVK